MEGKLKRLQEILDRSGFTWIHVKDYDFTQEDDMDEMDTDGVWGLATHITDWCLNNLSDDIADMASYGQVRCVMQTVLYNLIAEYKEIKE